MGYEKEVTSYHLLDRENYIVAFSHLNCPSSNQTWPQMIENKTDEEKKNAG